MLLDKPKSNSAQIIWSRLYFDLFQFQNVQMDIISLKMQEVQKPASNRMEQELMIVTKILKTSLSKTKITSLKDDPKSALNKVHNESLCPFCLY